MVYLDIKKLNKTTIQALQECLDFIQNGWIHVGDLSDYNVWIVLFRKPSTGESLKIRVFKESYDIWRDGVLKKIVGYKPAGLKD